MAVATELVRVVSDGERLVASRSSAGRGAWLCAGSPACVDLAGRRGGFARALRRPVDDAAVAALAAALAGTQPVGHER